MARLYDSVGFIAIMHHRGTVTGIDETFARASVWIEQEIAIAAFMGQILNRPLQAISYYEQGIRLEGVRQFILLNPRKFVSSQDILRDLETVLPTWSTPLYDNLALHEREAIKRKLNVVSISALHPRLTIGLTNRSNSTIFVKSVSLWHGQRRLNGGVPSDNRDAVEVGPHRENVPIAFITDDDAMLKMKTWGVVDVGLPNYSFRDDVDIEVRIEYTVAGVEDECSEQVAVRVHGTRQIESR